MKDEWKLKDQFTVLAIEEPFRFTIEGLPVPIIGIMDLVEEDPSGSIMITDSKTSSRSYSEEEADRNFQLSIYHMAAKANGYGNKKISLKTGLPDENQEAKVHSAIPLQEPKLTNSESIKKIKKVWDAIQKGIFIPNDDSWRCKDCGY